MIMINDNINNINDVNNEWWIMMNDESNNDE